MLISLPVQPKHGVKMLRVLNQMPQRHGPDAFFNFPGRSAAVSVHIYVSISNTTAVVNEHTQAVNTYIHKYSTSNTIVYWPCNKILDVNIKWSEEQYSMPSYIFKNVSLYDGKWSKIYRWHLNHMGNCDIIIMRFKRQFVMHIMIHGSLFLAADQRMLWMYSREATCASCLFVFLLYCFSWICTIFCIFFCPGHCFTSYCQVALSERIYIQHMVQNGSFE